MSVQYVVDENGERTAVLLDIKEYERMIAQSDASADIPGCGERQHGESITDEMLGNDEDIDAEEAERRITKFITTADELPGPSVADLTDRITGLMQEAWREVEKIMSGNLHNKVLATQLLLSQRARGLQPDDLEQWWLFAGTSLLSGMISASAGGVNK